MIFPNLSSENAKTCLIFLLSRPCSHSQSLLAGTASLAEFAHTPRYAIPLCWYVLLPHLLEHEGRQHRPCLSPWRICARSRGFPFGEVPVQGFCPLFPWHVFIFLLTHRYFYISRVLDPRIGNNFFLSLSFHNFYDIFGQTEVIYCSVVGSSTFFLYSVDFCLVQEIFLYPNHLKALSFCFSKTDFSFLVDSE